MPRYIDADVLKHELCIRQHMLNADSLWKTLEIMDAQPTADVVERKKGKWIDIGDYCVCNQCGHTEQQFNGVEQIPLHTPFCAMCGADLREEKTNDKRNI